MKRENLERLAVIIGTVLMVAAVTVLIAACDTINNAACEDLEGSWEVDFFATEPDTCGAGSNDTDYVNFYVFPESKLVYMQLREEPSSDPPLYMTGEIECDGKDFTISWTGDPAVAGLGCTLTMSVAIDGSFGSNDDEFTGIWVSSKNYDGACNPESQYDCLITYDILAVRQP